MFTGIVEKTGKIVRIEKENTNYHFTIEADFADELKIDQSMAHDGCCLTVVRVDYAKKQYVVTAMDETMLKTNLGNWKVGYEVNLERSMSMNGRFDGHIVQGHVDQTATCLAVEDQEGSHQYTFRYQSSREMVSHGYFTVDKGSVTVNGVSLTVCRPTEDTFQVCIIPYTFQNTNFHNIKPGSVVNIEFDIIGKYLARMNSLL